MFLAASLDAGFVALEELQSIVSRWLPERVCLESEVVTRNEMRARTLRVLVEAEPAHPQHHEHPHEHSHAHSHDYTHEHTHHHRNLADVDAFLDQCPIPAGAIARAKRMFFELAEAEAHVHGIAIEAVHFHEVGATDSLVDFALAGFVLDRLGARVEASPAILGRGHVKMDHGLWPVPPPGTAEILKRGGIPTRPVPASFPWENAELLTPTGACLLRRAERFGDLPAGRVAAIGVGAGTVDVPGFPNVTRLLLIESDEKVASRWDTDRVAILETWIDDLPGNLLAEACEEMLRAGALDVATSSATFKKGRVGYRVEVLAPPERAEAVAGILLGRTTAIGLRVRESVRWKLYREEVRSQDGLRAKLSSDATGDIARVVPETDAVVNRARETGVSPVTLWRVENTKKNQDP